MTSKITYKTLRVMLESTSKLHSSRGNKTERACCSREMGECMLWNDRPTSQLLNIARFDYLGIEITWSYLNEN